MSTANELSGNIKTRITAAGHPSEIGAHSMIVAPAGRVITTPADAGDIAGGIVVISPTDAGVFATGRKR